MIFQKPRIFGLLSAAAMVGLVIFAGFGVLHADRDDLSKAVFFVT